MAPDQNKNPGGGNKPKPGNPSSRPQGQSAKDKSRAQSRPVSAKAPAGKAGGAGGKRPGGGGPGGGGSGGGNRPRSGGGPTPPPKRRTISGAAYAWGAVALVVVVIGVLVIVKVASGSSSASATDYTPVKPAPASVVHDVTTIPLSVYDKIGVTSPTVSVTPPIIVKGQPDLVIDGKSPTMLYEGAEYCPFCAAERWAMTAALSRFGTWSGLKITASSHTDTDPETHTFSYYGASFTSPYLQFKGIEQVSNIPTPTYYKPLMKPTAQEQKNINKYETSTYIPGLTGQGYPFVNINNLALISGPSYDPGILSGQTWSQIAGGLANPSNPATQAIVATANYISASICASTKNAPAAVCTSSGVQAAARALKLS